MFCTDDSEIFHSKCNDRSDWTKDRRIKTKANSVVVVVAGIQLIIPEVGGKSFFSDAFK